jgi:hypothetical protein
VECVRIPCKVGGSLLPYPHASPTSPYFDQSAVSNRASFKDYIAEDVYYLDVFARAFRIALGKSAGLPANVSRLLTELHDGIAEELKLHKGYERETARSMDLCLDERQAKRQATTNYTDFLLSTAETEVQSRLLKRDVKFIVKNQISTKSNIPVKHRSFV